ncbi:hypothetical protein LINPERHAP1_LOCUS43265, partial [Linum perenne]
ESPPARRIKAFGVFRGRVICTYRSITPPFRPFGALQTRFNKQARGSIVRVVQYHSQHPRAFG